MLTTNLLQAMPIARYRTPIARSAAGAEQQVRRDRSPPGGWTTRKVRKGSTEGVSVRARERRPGPSNVDDSRVGTESGQQGFPSKGASSDCFKARDRSTCR